jgi:hypothetical protein
MEDSGKSNDIFHVYRLRWVFLVFQSLILIRVVHVPSADHLEEKKKINKCEIPIFKHSFISLTKI